MKDEHRVEIEGQRESIAWCGQCGNISVDGINFTRVEDGLECAGCGAVSPHFEYVRKSSLDHLRDARGDGEGAPGRDGERLYCRCEALRAAAKRVLEADMRGVRDLDALNALEDAAGFSQQGQRRFPKDNK